MLLHWGEFLQALLHYTSCSSRCQADHFLLSRKNLSYNVSMMAELRSELSWSVSRAKMLRECARRYYYHYYLSWGGWKPDAPPDCRKAYLLKSMVNLDMLAGQVVHDVIREIFNREREMLGRVSCEQARKLATTKLRDACRQSKEQLWRRSPKRFTNIFEHYYERDVPPSRRGKIKETVETCIVSFYASETFRLIQRAGAGRWLTIDQMDFFDFAGVKVYAAPDFALRDGQTVHIYDWKTGKPSVEVDEQLSCYALFAAERWKVRPNRIVPVAIYLRESKVEHVEVTEERLAHVKDHIRDSLSEMIELLRSVEHNLPRDSDAFPPTQLVGQCSRCFFAELCEPHAG